MTFLDVFWTYLQMPSTQMAVLFPFLLSLCVLLLSRGVPLGIVLWWAAFTAVSSITARWEHTPEGNALFILPWFVFFVAVTLYLGYQWKPGHVYSLSFLSLLSVDVWRSYLLSLTNVIPAESFYHGVGGAGALDGLFIDPLLAVALVGYVRWRRERRVFARVEVRKGRGHASPNP